MARGEGWSGARPRWRLVVSLLAALGGALPGPAAARQKPSATATAVPAAPPPLSRALDSLAWDPAQRGGPLLVVDPENTRSLDGRSLPPAPRTGYRASTLGPFYGRKAVRVGPALTVFAPETMVVLDSAPPEEPDLLTGVPREQRAKMLLASLTPEQWRRLCGPGGLGPGDVDREQAALFRSLVPLPFPVRQVRTDERGREAETLSSRDLSDSERGGVRLRLHWAFGLTMPVQGGDPLFPAGVYSNADDALPPSARAFVLGAAQGPDPTIRPEDFDPFADLHYGKEVRRELPNRLKPGDLGFAAPAWDARVRLEDGRTVGDWVRAVGEAAGEELHADRRVAGLSVRLIGADGGTSVRAGDLLQALCLAVTGTFRRIAPDDGTPPLYLLTHDLEGIAVQKRRVLEWRGELSSRVWAERERLTARLHAAEAPRYLDFAPEAYGGMAVPPAVRAAIRREYAERRKGVPHESATVALTELSPEMRRLVDQSIQRLGSGSRPRRVSGDRATIYSRARLSFVIPGVDAPVRSFVQLPGWDLVPFAPRPAGQEDGPTPDAPLALPTAPGRTAALLIAPEDPEAAGRLVAEARRRGFTEVWVDAPESEGDAKAILSAAVAAGRREGVAVRAAVSLLRTRLGEDAVPGDQRDRGIDGETWTAWKSRRGAAGDDPYTPEASRRAEAAAGDWLRCDHPAVRDRLLRRLRALVAVPGLAGVALRDAAANGYAVSGRFDNYSTDTSGRWSGGHVPALRAALVRKAGIDPVDDASFYGGGEYLALPFFSDRSNRPLYRETGERLPDGFPRRERLPVLTTRQEWQALRDVSNRRLLAEVRSALRTAAPDLPVLLAERSGGAWYGVWEEPDAPPNAEYVPEGEVATQGRRAESRRPTALRHVAIDPRFLEPRLAGAPDGSDPRTMLAYQRSLASGWRLSMDESRALARGAAFDPPLAPIRYLPNVLRRAAAPERNGAMPWSGFVLDLSRIAAEADVVRLLEAGVAPAPPAAR